MPRFGAIFDLRPLLNNSVTPQSRVIHEKLAGSQPIKEFLAYYGTRRFMKAFTTVRQLSLSWAISIQSNSSNIPLPEVTP